MANHSQSERGMNESNLSDDALAELLTLSVEADEYGTTYYRNQLGQFHRVHGPAVIYSDGSKHWCIMGQRHRTDGPAVEWSDGVNWWFMNGQRFSEEEFHERTQSL